MTRRAAAVPAEVMQLVAHGVFRVDSPAKEGTVTSAGIPVDVAPRPGTGTGADD